MRVFGFALLLFAGAAALQVAFVLFAFGELGSAGFAAALALGAFVAAGWVHRADAEGVDQ